MSICAAAKSLEIFLLALEDLCSTLQAILLPEYFFSWSFVNYLPIHYIHRYVEIHTLMGSRISVIELVSGQHIGLDWNKRVKFIILRLYAYSLLYVWFLRLPRICKNCIMFWGYRIKKSESLQTEGRHFKSTICKINDV